MRLLLVEDERELSNALVAILKHNNYTVDPVYNGEDALAYLACTSYDGVVLDINIPEINGFDVLKTMRSRGDKTPVIILTARNDINDKVYGLDSGADDYLSKPFNAKELLARIRAITRRTGDIIDNVLSFGDLTLNTSTFKMSCKNKEVLLTNKEYQILELFMKNNDKTVALDTIINKIYNYDDDIDVGVVWTHLYYLRKKMSNLGTTVKIKAIRNIGYQLIK